MAMLDLSVYKEQYFELALFDGDIIHLRKPSQRVNVLLMSVQEQQLEAQSRLFNQKNPYTAAESLAFLDDLEALVLAILNNNREGKLFTEEYIRANFTDKIIATLIKEYRNWIVEVLSSPN